MTPKPPCFCCDAEFKGPHDAEYPWECACIDFEICSRCWKCEPHCVCDEGFHGCGKDLRQVSKEIKEIKL